MKDLQNEKAAYGDLFVLWALQDAGSQYPLAGTSALDKPYCRKVVEQAALRAAVLV